LYNSKLISPSIDASKSGNGRPAINKRINTLPNEPNYPENDYMISNKSELNNDKIINEFISNPTEKEKPKKAIEEEKNKIGIPPPPEDFKLMVLNKKHPITNFYNFGELLGSGSFASVYACVDLETGYRVAIKVLKKNKMRGRERKNLLEMEIEIMFVVKVLIENKYFGIESLC